MKINIYLFLHFFFLVQYHIHAQSIGARAGFILSSSRVKYAQGLNEDLRINPHTGFQLGVDYTRVISEKLALIPSVVYAGKGFTSENLADGRDIESNFKIHLNYIEFSALVKWSHWLNNNSNIVFLMGPDLGVGVGGKKELISTGVVNTPRNRSVSWGTGAGQVNKWDLGGVFGIGTESGKLGVYLFWTESFTESFSISNGDQSFRNRVLFLLTTIKF